MTIPVSERLRLIANDLAYDASPESVMLIVERLAKAQDQAIGQEKDLAEAINDLGRMARELIAANRMVGDLRRQLAARGEREAPPYRSERQFGVVGDVR